MTDKHLSVIIVAYNALPYLDLTLRSVLQAINHIDAEIIVIDNASNEPVSEWINNYYQDVILIPSSENLGFGKANNLGLKSSSGKVILYLNPDTIIQRSNIDAALSAFEGDANIGAIGMRMINGKGIFLPESKRSVPTIWSTFSRVVGLSNLFPNSKFFSSYRMGHISEKSLVSNVVVLSGACMFINVNSDDLKEFDTDFFMYGEDIDLSYRIKKAGYSLKYIGSETLVHFKGESTNKKNWSYHYWFYKTMWLFRLKHFKGFANTFLNLLIFPAIHLLMIGAYIKSKFKSEKKIDKSISSYYFLGQVSAKLSLGIKKFANNAIETSIDAADLIVINVEYPDLRAAVTILDKKKKSQKVIFWNENMGKFFGAY